MNSLEETVAIDLDETVSLEVAESLDFDSFFSMQDNLIIKDKVNNMKGGKECAYQ